MDADNTPVARISNDFLDYQYQVLGILGYLSSPDVTEIFISRPGEVYLEGRDGWNRVDVPSLTFERARQFCTAVVNESNTGQRITDTYPVVSLTFPTGQRAQFVIPPACDAGKVSITIRLPSKQTRKIGRHTSELQSLMRISYAVFCLKKHNPTQHHELVLDILQTHHT